jgi:hypothetical protein
MKTIKERFLEKINKNAPNGCWEWIGYISPNGYGNFYVEGSVYSHRFSYEFFKGPIPKGKMVCHTCDNRRCVNPDHLWLGTHTDNMRDAIAKGRLNPRKLNQPRGDEHGMRKHPERANPKFGSEHSHAKLTEEIVSEVRKRYIKGERVADMAREYGIHSVTMRDSIRRKTWKHVE